MLSIFFVQFILFWLEIDFFSHIFAMVILMRLNCISRIIAHKTEKSRQQIIICQNWVKTNT